MKPIQFHPDAEAELVASAAYYEEQQKDLGKRFLTSIQNSLNRIRINPLLYPAIKTDVRRSTTKTFPFDILFKALPEKIVIVAVMHQHRNPNYWKNR